MDSNSCARPEEWEESFFDTEHAEDAVGIETEGRHVYTAAMRALLPLPLLTLACVTVAAPPAAPPASLPTLPAHLSDPDHNPPPSCPGSSHLSAVGASTQGREDALAHAKRNLLTKLGNSIHVEAESFSRLVSVDGQQSAEYRDVQRVLEKVDFRHSDLIEIVDAPQRQGNETYVVACLPRGPAIARLESDLDTEVKRFDTWDKTAQEAQARGDRPAFVTALVNLSVAMAAVAPTLVQIRALAGAPARVEQRLTSRWLALVEASTKLRAQVRFVLDVQAGERMSLVAAELTEFFRLALAPLGSEVRLAPTCPQGPTATYLITVRADAECSRGSLGPTCRPVFEVMGQECGTGRQVFRTGLEKINVNAADPRGEEHALRAMVRKISPKDIQDELRAAMKSELPGEETR
jgi:hypothetical protein